MPTLVNKCELSELSHAESPNEFILETHKNTLLNIEKRTNGKTVISLPLGNYFDIVNGKIIIYDKV